MIGGGVDVASASIVVVHDTGDEAAGGAWRDALHAYGWGGPVVAPDLPGHATVPAPAGGSYEHGDAVLHVLPAMRAAGAAHSVVVGVGSNGWIATVLALGGEASALVLIDGLGGPWLTPAEEMKSSRERLRALSANDAAMRAAPPSRLDPRAALGVAHNTSRRLAERAAVAMPVPVLVLTSPACPLSADERDDLVSQFATGATVVAVPDRTAATAVPEMLRAFSH